MYKEVIEKIKDAQYVLIGLGEEFDDLQECKKSPEYEKGRATLIASNKNYFLPAYDDLYREQRKEYVKKALENLLNCIKDKNYFIVTTSVNYTLQEMPWQEGRFTAPCGGSIQKQCVQGCASGLQVLSKEERILQRRYLQEMNLDALELLLGKCPECGKPLILNNVYTEFYDENGYLESWQKYRSWLQGTMNRKVVILELGVGLQCPSVIRFPFEKMAFYNQKASFYRVHENLYQLAEDLQGKAFSISKNSIDWLQFLC